MKTLIAYFSAEGTTAALAEKLAEEIGDADKSAELVAAVKQVVAENELKDESDIRDVIINISNQIIIK